MIDLTKKKELINFYAGSEKKKTFVMNGQKYLVKFPNPTSEKSKSLSYANNVFSEFLGSHIFQNLGFSSQETTFGKYTQENGIEKIVCLCLDFTDEKHKLTEFDKLLISNVEFNKKATTNLKDILENFHHNKELSNVTNLISFFWKCLL